MAKKRETVSSKTKDGSKGHSSDEPVLGHPGNGDGPDSGDVGYCDDAVFGHPGHGDGPNFGHTGNGDGPVAPRRGPWEGFPLPVGLGYHRDTPDDRDLTPEKLRDQLTKTHGAAVAASHLFRRTTIDHDELQSRVDLRDKLGNRRWPAEQQGSLNSCTAHAVIGLIEFLLQRGCKQYRDLSRLFLYKTARQIARLPGDSGATLRATLKAVNLFGVPEESYWPYDIRNYDVSPDAFLYAFAHEFRSLLYARLDVYDPDEPRRKAKDQKEDAKDDSHLHPGQQMLWRLKRALKDGLPVAFGFPIYGSVTIDEDIPPPSDEPVVGGHAVLAMGYDNERAIGSSKGAVLFRNSWGTKWGDKGYGYLPYEYVTGQYAVDFWTVFRPSWLSALRFDASR